MCNISYSYETLKNVNLHQSDIDFIIIDKNKIQEKGLTQTLVSFQVYFKIDNRMKPQITPYSRERVG